MTETKSDYTYKGDTWHPTSATCPECDAPLASNGRIHDCKSCDHWEVL